jgi:hypothetical protein
MSKNQNQNKNQQDRVLICEDKALPPASSGSNMPKVKPVAESKPAPSTKS